MSRATHVTVLAADPTAPVARLGAAADEVAVVTERDGLVADPDSVLVVSGPADPALVGAAATLAWRAVALDLSVAPDSGTLAALTGLGPGSAQWIGDLPLLVLVPGATAPIAADVLGPVSRLLTDRRSHEDELSIERRALEADREAHADAVGRLRAERERLTAESGRLEERARKAERGRSRAEAELERLRATIAVRAAATAGRLRRRIPGGRTGALALGVLALVCLVAGVWLAASTGHAGLAVLGAAGLVVGTATALLVVQESRHVRARVDEGAGRAATALGELRRSQKSVRTRVAQLDAKHDEVVGRLGRLELMLAHRDPSAVDPSAHS